MLKKCNYSGGLEAKIPSAKPIWNGFLLVTVRVLNSYEKMRFAGDFYCVIRQGFPPHCDQKGA